VGADPFEPGFVVWLTGLPASGKSTIATALTAQLAQRGVRAAVLESDELRRILTPQPTYSPQERDTFYAALTHIARLLSEQGVPVILDATAHRRAYRDTARAILPRFIEVFVDCPLEVCKQRDPKGIYRGARADLSNHVPGLNDPYEPPLNPDITVRGDQDSPGEVGVRIVAELDRRGYIGA